MRCTNYDFYFRKGNKEKYCFELIVENFKTRFNNLKFNAYSRMALRVYTCDTFLKSSLFDKVVTVDKLRKWA